MNTTQRTLPPSNTSETLSPVVKETPVVPVIVKRTEPSTSIEMKPKSTIIKADELRDTKEVAKEKKKKRKRVEIDAHELIEQALFPKLTVKLGSGTSHTSSPIPILKSHISPPSSPKVKRKELDHKDHEKDKEREKLKKDKESSLKLPKKEDKKEQKKADEGVKVKDDDVQKKVKKKAKVIITPTRAARKEMAEKNCTLITQTVSTVESDDKIWICPSCSKPDDGSPMIGCDNCDEWHHWACVGINEPPTDDESWFCKICISKQQQIESKFKKRKIKKTDFEPSHSSDRPRVPPKEEPDHDHEPKPLISIKMEKPIVSEEGEWICPACQRPDDGSPMIGCDQCDQWFHWICVGITVEPSDQDKWFCRRCKKHSDSSGKKKKHKK